jgi:flagellar basal body-associated protein FliL
MPVVMVTMAVVIIIGVTVVMMIVVVTVFMIVLLVAVVVGMAHRARSDAQLVLPVKTKPAPAMQPTGRPAQATNSVENRNVDWARYQ